MKKQINLIAAVIICIFTSITGLKAATVHFNYATGDTTVDPKKHPGAIDLNKHPDVMAKAFAAARNGQIAYRTKNGIADTTIDLSKHPEIVKAILKDPSHWSAILKPYDNGSDTLTVQGKNKQVIREIMTVLISKRIIKERSDITSFLLTDKKFMLNGRVLNENLHQELKAKYIKSPDYVVYYGNSEMTGNGIFQRADNL